MAWILILSCPNTGRDLPPLLTWLMTSSHIHNHLLPSSSLISTRRNSAGRFIVWLRMGAHSPSSPTLSFLVSAYSSVSGFREPVWCFNRNLQGFPTIQALEGRNRFLFLVFSTSLTIPCIHHILTDFWWAWRRKKPVCEWQGKGGEVTRLRTTLYPLPLRFPDDQEMVKGIIKAKCPRRIGVLLFWKCMVWKSLCVWWQECTFDTYWKNSSFLSFFLPPSIHYMCIEHCWPDLWPLGTQTKIWPSAGLQLDGWDKPVNNQYGSGEVQTAVRPCERGEVSIAGFWSGLRRGELEDWEETWS